MSGGGTDTPEQKVVQTSTKADPQPASGYAYIPDNAWLIVAVGIGVFLLLVGLRIYRSKQLKIDTARVDIECDSQDTPKDQKSDVS